MKCLLASNNFGHGEYASILISSVLDLPETTPCIFSRLTFLKVITSVGFNVGFLQSIPVEEGAHGSH